MAFLAIAGSTGIFIAFEKDMHIPISVRVVLGVVGYSVAISGFLFAYFIVYKYGYPVVILVAPAVLYYVSG